ALAVALETIEGDLGRSDVALKSSSGEVGIAALRLKKSVLDELVLDSPVVAHLAGRSVSAVEAHEGVGKSIAESGNVVLIVDVLRNAVVDIEKSYRIAGEAYAYVLGESAVDIDLAGYGNSAGSETAVYIAGLKAELAGECRPAL